MNRHEMHGNKCKQTTHKIKIYTFWVGKAVIRIYCREKTSVLKKRCLRNEESEISPQVKFHTGFFFGEYIQDKSFN